MKKVQSITYRSKISQAFAILLLLLASSCDKEDTIIEEHPQVPTEEKVDDTGQMKYALNIASGSGLGTAEDPAIATASEAIDITISQTSSYNDINGSTYTCNPLATIRLKVDNDTVRATSLADLLAISEKSAVALTGTNPLTKQLLQTFSLGGQTITFNLQHEVYTYTDSKQNNIEMPYIKLNAAKHGEAQSQATRSEAVNAPVITGIQLCPIEKNATRGSYMKEQTYLVSVAFNLDVESEHLKENIRQKLAFKAQYTGIVETSTEYPDPTTALSAHVNAAGGTQSVQSPFIMTQGSDSMRVEWMQQSSYTFFSVQEKATKLVSFDPKAYVTFSLAADTAYAASPDSLKMVEKEGAQTGEKQTRVYNIGGQLLTVKWSYEELKPVEIDGQEIAMPYLELSEPELTEVTIAESSDTIAGVEGKLYHVSVHFKQETREKNINEANVQSVDYVINYVGFVEEKLLDVKEGHDYYWYPAHDNLWEHYIYIFYRASRYSTGEVKTTYYWSGGFGVSGGCIFDKYNYYGLDENVIVCNDTTMFRLHKVNIDYEEKEMNHDYGRMGAHWTLETTKTGVPDISKAYLDYGSSYENNYGDYDKYKRYEGSLFNPMRPIEAWYDGAIDDTKFIYLCYPDVGVHIRESHMAFRYTDHFLYFENHMETFPEFKPKTDLDIKERNITMTNGAPAKIYTYTLDAQFLGKDYHYMLVDTVYQFSPEELKEMEITK